MKVRVTYKTQQIAVDQVFTGPTPEAVVEEMQKTVAMRVNFAIRVVLNAMSPLAFAQTVVSRYNDTMKRTAPSPNSCEEFLQLCETEGIAVILEH